MRELPEADCVLPTMHTHTHTIGSTLGRDAAAATFAEISAQGGPVEQRSIRAPFGVGQDPPTCFPPDEHSSRPYLQRPRPLNLHNLVLKKAPAANRLSPMSNKKGQWLNMGGQ